MSGEFAPPRPNPAMDAEDRARDALVACGLTEVITYSLTDPAWCMRLGLEADVSGFVCLANPMTADRTHLRRHILPGLLETLRLQPALRRPRRDLRAGARLPPLGGAAPRGAAAAGAAAQRRIDAAVVGQPGAAAVRLLPRQGDSRDARRAAQRRAAGVRAVRGLAVPERPRRRRVARRRDGRHLRRARPRAAPRLRPARAAGGARRVRRRGAAGRRGSRGLPHPLALPGADAGPRDRLPGGDAGGADRGDGARGRGRPARLAAALRRLPRRAAAGGDAEPGVHADLPGARTARWRRTTSCRCARGSSRR